MSNVACAGCTVCCRDQLVLLMPDDEPRLASLEFFEIDFKGEAYRSLKHKPDGTCIHLGVDGCSVYENRPEVYRSYDCRMQFLIMSRNQRRAWKNQDIWREARKRLATLDEDDRAGIIGYYDRATGAEATVFGKLK